LSWKIIGKPQIPFLQEMAFVNELFFWRCFGNECQRFPETSISSFDVVSGMSISDFPKPQFQVMIAIDNNLEIL